MKTSAPPGSNLNANQHGAVSPEIFLLIASSLALVLSIAEIVMAILLLPDTLSGLAGFHGRGELRHVRDVNQTAYVRDFQVALIDPRPQGGVAYSQVLPRLCRSI